MIRSLVRHHPRIGYTYVPDLKTRVPTGTGGYLLRTNGAGFRSDHEFAAERPAGTYRVLLFGDSQTAGDGVPNGERYSSVLERLLPGLSVCNFGLTGSGTDQHFLAYREFRGIEHDLVVLAINVDNIWRVQRSVLRFQDSRGNAVYHSKPRFELGPDGLSLRGVPVPAGVWSETSLPAEQRGNVLRFDEANFLSGNAKSLLARALPFAPVRDLMRSSASGASIGNMAKRVTGFRPVPDYDAPDSPGWLLLRAIIETWIDESRAPMLVVPIPLRAFVDGASDPSAYQARFRELSGSAGCLHYDPLPALAALPAAERSGLWDQSGHFSRQGHRVFAHLVAPEFARQMGQTPPATASGRAPALSGEAPRPGAAGD
jgi:hypothetical protein